MHDNFEYVTSGLLGQEREKSIDEIQSMLSSAKAKFVSKRAVGVTADLANMSRNSSHKCSRAIVTSKDECFNYHRMGHFGQDCKFLNYHTKKKSSTRQNRENNLPKLRPCRANATTNIANDNDSDLEPFYPGKAFITMESPTILQIQSTWCLDSCAFRHLTNDQSLFVGKIHLKT